MQAAPLAKMPSPILQQGLNEWENSHLGRKSPEAAPKAGMSDVAEMMPHSTKQLFQGVSSKVRAGFICNNL